MCRGTQIHTLIYLAYIPMSEQGQLPKSAANQEGIFGFQERTNKMTQRDTVCSDSNGDDAGRYKKVQRLNIEALQLTVSHCLWLAPWYTLRLHLRIPDIYYSAL